MICLCEDKAHFSRLKSENYDWQVYEGKSVQINQSRIEGFLMNYHYLFWFALLATDFIYKAFSPTQQQIFLGLLIKVSRATTADAPLK